MVWEKDVRLWRALIAAAAMLLQRELTSLGSSESRKHAAALDDLRARMLQDKDNACNLLKQVCVPSCAFTCYVLPLFALGIIFLSTQPKQSVQCMRYDTITVMHIMMVDLSCPCFPCMQHYEGLLLTSSQSSSEQQRNLEARLEAVTQQLAQAEADAKASVFQVLAASMSTFTI